MHSCVLLILSIAIYDIFWSVSPLEPFCLKEKDEEVLLTMRLMQTVILKDANVKCKELGEFPFSKNWPSGVI